jgi:hypothetical protein
VKVAARCGLDRSEILTTKFAVLARILIAT